MHYRFLVIVALLAVSTWLDFISILTYVGYELQLPAVYVALVSIAMLFPQAFLGKQLANIVKKYSPKKVFVYSTVGRIICTISLVWIESIYVLLFVLLVRAFSLGLLQPIIASQVKVLAQSQSGRFASILNLINTVSKVVAPSVGGVISVLFSERYVFVLSALLACLALLIILSERMKDPIRKQDSYNGPPNVIDRSILIPFSFVILFVGGISAMYTNLIPYAFNFYSVPKLALSIALSVSAVSGILFNLWIIKKNPTTSDFPTLHFFFAWFLSASFFIALSFSMLSGEHSLILIPLAFAGITVARAYFEVFSNSYIYSFDSTEAVSLATLKQSLVSLVGIIATIFGAIGFSYSAPITILVSVAIISLVVSMCWLVFLWKNNQVFSQA